MYYSAILVFFYSISTVASLNVPLTRRAPPSIDSANWIWTSDTTSGVSSATPAGTHVFRKTFVTPSSEKARSANVLITADNHFTLYLNGQLIGVSPAEWQKGSVFQISNIRPDKNVFAIKATNDDSTDVTPVVRTAAGLLVSIEITLESGLIAKVVSDSTWISNLVVVPDFEKPETSEAGWELVTVIGAYGMSPWERFVNALPDVAVTATVGGLTITAKPSSSRAVSSSSSSPISTAISAGSQNGTKSSPTGPIVGAVVGVVAVLIGIAVFIFLRRRRVPRPHSLDLNQSLSMVQHPNALENGLPPVAQHQYNAPTNTSESHLVHQSPHSQSLPSVSGQSSSSSSTRNHYNIANPDSSTSKGNLLNPRRAKEMEAMQHASAAVALESPPQYTLN